MSIQHFENSAGLSSSGAVGRQRRRVVASHGDERTKIMLREALAREGALRRRMEAVIQRQQEDLNKLLAWQAEAAARLASLTLRQRQVIELILAGHPNKNIAANLGISQRTVENHRASIMKKTGSKSLPALARLALAAAWNSAPDSVRDPNSRHCDVSRTGVPSHA
ncbi:MAG TPA: LuxR C-terminal-related transcriptional regulator [Stellaceae bacterium]|nr:LuxR C-terminal-related transcriptional regulator [Stellaceae bacterium]